MEPADIVVVGAGAGAKVVWNSVRDRSVVVVEKGLVGGHCPYLACVPSKAMLRSASVWGLAADDQFRGLFTGRAEPADAYRQAVAHRERIVNGRNDSPTAAALEKTGARLLRGTGARLTLGSGDHVEVERVVLATGRRPYTDGLGLEALGVQVGPGQPFEIDTEASARAAGIEPAVASAAVSDTVRPATEGSADGWLKLVADPRRAILVGASAMGGYAEGWISEVSLAIRAEVPVAVHADVVHPFPTYGEILEGPLWRLAAP
ncbi:MAG TPA: hypothetical protein VHM23_24410 [Actinomycetota bacterium]|jgi:pyruvate/2-oxoglutarate dehydrogenase complex dihydrolipoamide dehydrogenase (E3) component|nr:hypothetical protein [Actinomycetota bacterium]